ncbi:MAG: hypothetical protein KGM49_05110 [Sphingomonadales bacterium]|nr:hypothetical protein [Sphingomonadales bacterium]
MALPRSDQNELVLPLLEDLLTDTPWDTFLRRLLSRAGADRVHLLVRAGAQPPTLHRRVEVHGWSGRDAGLELAALGGPSPALRPNRSYALDELRVVDNAKAREAQDEALARTRIGDARLIRIGAGERSVWLILLSERAPFGAADSALLTALAPAVELTAEQLDAIGRLRLRAAAAEESLALLGIGQAVLGADGAVLAADELWQTQQPALPPVEGGPFGDRRVAGDEQDPLLLRPLGADHSTVPATVASFRLPRREPPQSAAHILAATLGLSRREAMLAALLSQGMPLIEAGRSLRLTDETTRNYSKRIYARTGASGQADLVRMVLSGLAPLG